MGKAKTKTVRKDRNHSNVNRLKKTITKTEDTIRKIMSDLKEKL